MATNYPGGLDSLTNPGAGAALTSPSHAGQHANANDAIEAIETELGTDPSGGSATVKARFEVIEANDWVTAARIAADAVGSSEIAANAIGSSELADGAVTSAKIADGAVTSAKIAGGIKLAASGGDGVYLSTLTWPQIAAHRFGPAHYGENTVASARMCVAADIRVLECDFRRTTDGELVLMHDSTLDRTTDSTGTVAALTGAQIAAARVDDFGNLPFSGYIPQRVPTLLEVALQVRGKAVLVAEDKTGLSGASLTAAAGDLRSLGLLDTVLIQVADQSACERWSDEGFSTMFVTSDTLADPDEVRAKGIEWVGYSWLGTSADATRIAAAKAAGLKVATWTHTTYAGHVAALAAGSDMPMSNYPAFGAGNRYVDFTFTPAAIPAGVVPMSGGIDWVIDSGGLLRCTSTAAVERHADLYNLGPTDGSSVTFDVVFRHVGSSISDATRWGSLFLASHEGGYKSSATGYHIIARLNGTLNIYTWNGTATTSIATSTGASLSGDADHTLTVTVTPTTITASTNAGANSVISTDSTYRPAAWWPSWARASLPEIGLRSVGWTAPKTGA